MDVTVIVATHGAPEWIYLAYQRAIPSALGQAVPVVVHHGTGTLAQARNAAAAAVTTEWLIFHDGDDQWTPGFVQAMAGGTADLRAPRLVEVHPDGRRVEVDLRPRDIERMNPLPISTAIRTDMFHAAGGFQEWEAWEDYALWLTCVRRGATYEHIDGATQLLHMRPGSRNTGVRDPRRLHRRIREASR